MKNIYKFLLAAIAILAIAGLTTATIINNVGIEVPHINTTGIVNASGGLYTERNLTVGGGSPWVDVTAFGARCDGTTDDTIAIQNALDFADLHGYNIRLPVGICEITEQINMSCNQQTTLEGVNQDSIIRIKKNGGNGLVIGNSSKVTQRCGIKNVLFYGQSIDDGHAFDTNTSLVFINHVRGIAENLFFIFGDNGIDIHTQGPGMYSYNIYLSNIYIENGNKTGFLIERRDGASFLNSIMVSNLRIAHYGLQLDIKRGHGTSECSHHMFNNFYIETNSNNNYLLNMSGVKYSRFIGGTFDGTGAEQIYLNKTSRYNDFGFVSLDASVRDLGHNNIWIIDGDYSGISVNSTLNFQYGISQDVNFFDDYDHAGNEGSPYFKIFRESTADGDSSIRMNIDQYNTAWIESTGAAELIIQAPENKFITIGANGDENIQFFASPTNGKDPVLKWNTNVDSGGDVWLYMEINEDDGIFLISRSNTSIPAYNIRMPLIIGDGTNHANITMTSPNGNEWCCGVTDAGVFECKTGACANH